MAQFDVTVIGAGPGGYVAAIRCAQLGLKTAIIEKESRLGGTCLRVGCIPSKALLESSERVYQAKHHFQEHGIAVSGVDVDLSVMMGRKDKIVSDLTSGVKLLMQKNKIQVFEGMGSFVGPQKIQVQAADGSTQEIESKSVIIATGSAVIELPHVPFDGESIVSSTEALAFPEVPKHLVVIGAGAVGLEMGCVWSRLGAKVTVVELFDRITPFADKQISELFLRTLKSQGLSFMLEHKMTSVQKKDGQLTIEVEDKAGQKHTIEADRVLVSVGRRAYTDGLGLDKIGLQTDKRGKISINKHFQTSVAGVYAIGDVVDGPMLAHKAEDEGMAVAEIIAGLPGHVNYDAIPNIVYTDPELAMVGQTEEQLKEAGIAYKVGRYKFGPNGRAKALGQTEGMVKILSEASTDRILGFHIVGPRASELIAEGVLAMEFGASSEDIVRTSHAHPTLSEVIREAAMAVDKRAIHG
ncbi:MAG: dihydrolipoyl dehydrogenase [Myxococcales bacterium]|nr:dihydrolipoyl dehydrogenase [Myxococcales bacterium]